MRFSLIGDGAIAQKHRAAIENNGGELVYVYDPEKYPGTTLESACACAQYVVICSPSFLHREHIKSALRWNSNVIVEKPAFLPWEPPIDDDRINVVLQLRWMDLPETAEKVRVTMVRDEAYFKSWKGDPKSTGGLFYNLFIHYIDLANRLGAEFEGLVASEGEQIRTVDNIDIMKLDMNILYTKMYNDIICHDKGVRPKDIFYLHWLLNRNSEIYGFGVDALNKKIHIESSL